MTDAVKPIACLSCKHPYVTPPQVNFGGTNTYWVFCPDCGMHSPCYFEEAGAIKLWNDLPRTPPAGWKREDLEHLRRKMVGFADRAYCNSLDVARTTQCLGWEAKVKNGTYGEPEHYAHAEHNNWDGKHRGAWECIRMLDAMLSAAPENDDEQS